MAFVKQIGEGEATGPLKGVYDAARDRAGAVANIIKVMSLDPRSLRASMQLYVSIMKSDNALEAARREMLATVVSNINECHYCTIHHARDFGRESNNQPLAEQLIYDYRTASLTEADRALCDYAVKLTLTPGRVGAADVEHLRRQGLDDEAITIAAQVIGYFNYINRIGNGLGVDCEPWMSPSREEWDRRRGRDYLQALDAE